MSISNHIKDHIGLTEIASKFNIGDICESGRSNCPFCFGSKSMKTTRNQYFKCFKCGASGSVFDLLIAANKASDFSEALHLLRPLVDATYHSSTKHISLLEKLWSDLLSENSSVTIDWLQSRGIRVKDVPLDFLDEFAFWSPSISKKITANYTPQQIEVLEKYGLYPVYRFENRILTPVRNLSGRIVHFTGRSIDKNAEVRWLHTKGSPPINNYLYQLHTVQNQLQDYVIICEGVTDSMSLRALGEPALGCFGVNISLTQHAWALKKKEITHIVVLLDRDKYPIGTPKAGTYKSWSGMIPNLIELATELRVPIFCCMVPNWSGVKDVNEFLQEIDFDLVEFKRYLSNNVVTLAELALEMYLENIEEHEVLWSLFKHLPDQKAVNKLKQYIESSYNDWSEYMLAKSI